MGNSNPEYKKLLESMGFDYPLGEHQLGGSYIEYPGNGFNRICLFEYKNAPQNTFSLAIFSGDTSRQAKELFRHFSYAKALDLKKKGWTVKSNFHLSVANFG